jgi:predicted Zn-dependent peptidase
MKNNMKKVFFTLIALISLSINSQSIDYELYTLDNGLDVILHQENSSPVVTVSVMYHVGAKDEI